MTEYHEPFELLSEPARSFHRALKSLQEELEAVDWYNQRVEVAQDKDLAAVLAHNRDEEIEHACMVIEWLRRRMPGWEERLRTYVFTEKPILELEAEKEKREAGVAGDGALGIGSLKETK